MQIHDRRRGPRALYNLKLVAARAGATLVVGDAPAVLDLEALTHTLRTNTRTCVQGERHLTVTKVQMSTFSLARPDCF